MPLGADFPDANPNLGEYESRSIIAAGVRAAGDYLTSPDLRLKARELGSMAGEGFMAGIRSAGSAMADFAHRHPH